MRERPPAARTSAWVCRWVRYSSLLAGGVLLQTVGCVENPELAGYQIANLLRTAFVQILGLALVNMR